jgi:HEAT repeat protein
LCGALSFFVYKESVRTTDWTALAARLGVLRDERETSGVEHARLALETIVGADVLRSAVDHYVSSAPGAELARSVLSLLHPWSAMQRCHELFLGGADIEVRRAAIELLRVVADDRALPWIAEYLADPDPKIQFWGAGILDQMIYSGLVELEQCEAVLELMKAHPHERIREQYEALMENVQSIAEDD